MKLRSPGGSAVCGDRICHIDEVCTCPEDCAACQGDCCSVNGTPGCESPSVMDCVCDIDFMCCHSEYTWEDTRIELAISDCGLTCP